MSEVRYLLDENVNPVLRSALLNRDANLTVWQVGMLGALMEIIKPVVVRLIK